MHLHRGGLVVGEDARGQLQHRFEVQDVPIPAQPFIAVEKLRHLAGRNRRHPAGLFRRRGEILRPALDRLRPLDLTRRVAQRCPVELQPQRARRLRDQAQLGFDDARRAAAHRLGPEVDELAQRCGVKGSRLHPLHGRSSPSELPQPCPQLPRRTGRERHREHMPRIDRSAVDRMRDPVGDGAGLARARPRQHTNGSAHRFCDGSLLGIEPSENCVRHGAHHRRRG